MPARANFDIAETLVPARSLLLPKRNSASVSLSCGGPSPIELGAVGPDAVQDDNELSGDGDFGFLRSDAFGELGDPALQ
jgi:hypothetical protein